MMKKLLQPLDGRVVLFGLVGFAIVTFGVVARASYWRTVCNGGQDSCPIPDTSEVPADSTTTAIYGYAYGHTGTVGHLRGCVLAISSNSAICGLYYDQSCNGGIQQYPINRDVFRNNPLSGKYLNGFVSCGGACSDPFLHITFATGQH
jgi:hypothetical protein